jgi:hypothetical protein
MAVSALEDSGQLPLLASQLRDRSQSCGGT